jgi:hypothetical protein
MRSRASNASVSDAASRTPLILRSDFSKASMLMSRCSFMSTKAFLTDEKLAAEGSAMATRVIVRQVIWPNGVLASTAVGLAVDLVTNWTRSNRSHAYLAYDGNEGTVRESLTLRNIAIKRCPHFLDDEVGDPVLAELKGKELSWNLWWE